MKFNGQKLKRLIQLIFFYYQKKFYRNRFIIFVYLSCNLFIVNVSVIQIEVSTHVKGRILNDNEKI